MYQALLIISLIAAAFLIALAVLYVFALADHRKVSRLRRFSEAERDSVVFIFDNETLLDATPAARQLLATTPQRGTAWTRLATLLSPRFPRLNERIIDLAEMGEMEIKSADDSGMLHAEWHDGVARINLTGPEADGEASTIDGQSLLAMTHELETLRRNAELAPFPMWREDSAGRITWCNRAYLDLADSFDSDTDTRPWPPHKVFTLSEDTRKVPAQEGNPAIHRFAISPANAPTRQWYEVSELNLEADERFFFAWPSDRLVKAETLLHEFVTTISKTFAALPIGLAIFDRKRELALFNPALLDLTLLPAEFLIAKPTIAGFLDKLRAARMIPEPRDYKSWRQQISDLVAAAENGTYEESWTLPTGQTYRVTGRPHPDGAVALLFQDISAEISVARRFRAELDAGQAALDGLAQAVAVFTAGSKLSMSNAEYTRLWGTDPAAIKTDIALADAIRIWQARCVPSPVWDKLRSFVGATGHRETWTAPLALHDGRQLTCRVVPLAHGATLVDFSLASGVGEDPNPVSNQSEDTGGDKRMVVSS
ncbi:MAG: PAS-domain containing protein [Maritimibacter sp.]